MTDTEAQKTGRPILTAQRPMTRVGRAIEKGETRGLMKVVVDASTKQILGAAILGAAVTKQFMAFSTLSMPGCSTTSCSARFPFIRRCRN
jgi:pyruvate/2-oxoglutarate dehydrogenase complex dihydrolipoamide dehydrogenase (E3) component